MWRLEREKLSKFSGDLIAELMSIRITDELVDYARIFLEQFPEHESAPDIVGPWLRAHPTSETRKLAAHYLEQDSRCEDLLPIVEAVFNVPPNAKLHKLIEQLLERNPECFLWMRVFSILSYKLRSSRITILTLRWLELNRDNSELYIGSVAFFTRSPEVLKWIFEWSVAHQDAEFMPHALSDLIIAANKFNKPLVPQLVEFASKWVTDNPDNDEAGLIHWALIWVSRSEPEIRNGVDWYSSHKDSQFAWNVLSALMEIPAGKYDEYRGFAIDEAKQVMRAEPPRERVPVLAGTLVKVCPDSETIQIAKEVYDVTRLSWILITMLQVAPDEELIELAHQDIPMSVDTDIEVDMLMALLKAAPNSEDARRYSKAWIEKHPKDRRAKKLATLLDNP